MKAIIFAGSAVLWTTVCCAADAVRPLDAKPGLWESAVSTEIAGRPAMAAVPQIPEATLAKMPPEQRAQIEAMMKARGGGGAAPMKTKVCLTAESLKSGAYGQQDKSCTTKVVSSSASKQVVHVECAREGTTSAGDMTVELVDAQHIKGTMSMQTLVGGQTSNMKMSFDNKWISADCGTVKPVTGK